jgi:hypothetical protein
MKLIAPHLLPAFALLAGLLGCSPVELSSSPSGGSPPECSQWQPAQRMFAGDYVNSLGTADLDGDGKPEIVTAGVHSVGVLRNQGDGTFAKAVTYVQKGFSSYVAAADLNGDGKPDIVAPDFFSGKASVLLNNGDGTLTTGAEILVDPDPDAQPSGVAAVDLNGDGHPDLAFSVVFHDNSTINVLLNQGDGTWAPPVSYPAGDLPYTLVAADLDGDGKPDLATTDFASDELRVLLNQGDGTFAASVIYATGAEPVGLAAADLNADGRPDLVVVSTNTDSVSVYLQQESGIFATAVNYLAGTVATAVAVADLNGDGEPDLAITRDTGEANDLSVLYGEGKGTFGARVYSTLAHEAYGVAAADLNGDDAPDLVVSSIYGTVSVLLNCAE